MIINQNILAILRTLLNLEKKKKKDEKLYMKRTSTAATAEFAWKILTERKYLMNTI